MTDKIYFSADFEGANPKKEGITRVDDEHHILHAFSETKLESFRLETMLINNSGAPRRISVAINWPTEPFSELRDCFYIRHENEPDWTVAVGRTSPGKTCLTCLFPAGKTMLCLHPHYGYEDCENFISGLVSPHLEKNVVGTTENSRNIWLLKISSVPPENQCKSVFVCARNHANESSGNYCVEGMINWILSKDSLAVYARDNIRYYFMPMTNPDGVADGMARFTGLKCADLNKDADWHFKNNPGALPDKSHATFFKALDSVKPACFVNLHSYLFKFKDEIYGPSEKDIDNFTRFAPDQTESAKVWKKTISDQDSFPSGYCRKRFRTLSLLFEIPWFGRNAASMRNMGIKLIKALILANTLQTNGWGKL